MRLYACDRCATVVAALTRGSLPVKCRACNYATGNRWEYLGRLDDVER